MKVHLLNLALKIFEMCKKHNILLSMTWVPRELNDRADYYSKVTDHDDWAVHQNWYNHIARLLGRPTVDRFADVDNRKTVRFNSRFYHHASGGTDAFTQQWAGEINWLCPPIHLITRAIDYLQLCQAKGIIVFPQWKSAYFWPRIVQLYTSNKNIKGS